MTLAQLIANAKAKWQAWRAEQERREHEALDRWFDSLSDEDREWVLTEARKMVARKKARKSK